MMTSVLRFFLVVMVIVVVIVIIMIMVMHMVFFMIVIIIIMAIFLVVQIVAKMIIMAPISISASVMIFIYFESQFSTAMFMPPRRQCQIRVRFESRVKTKFLEPLNQILKLKF